MKELALRIGEDEETLEELFQESPALKYVRSLPGMGPILAAVVVTEIDGIERFPSAQKLCRYAGLCPSTSSSGGKTFQGKLLPHCNKWLRWAFVEAAWVAIGCSAYFRDFYKRKRALGKKPNTAILATAPLMARITWQLLTHQRGYTSVAQAQYLRSRPAERTSSVAVGLAKEVQKRLRRSPSHFPQDFPLGYWTPSEYAGRKTNWFDGGCAPPNPAPLAAAGVRGELRSNATKWQTNKNQNTKEAAELQI